MGDKLKGKKSKLFTTLSHQNSLLLLIFWNSTRAINTIPAKDFLLVSVMIIVPLKAVKDLQICRCSADEFEGHGMWFTSIWSSWNHSVSTHTPWMGAGPSWKRSAKGSTNDIIEWMPHNIPEPLVFLSIVALYISMRVQYSNVVHYHYHINDHSGGKMRTQ